MKFFLHIPSNQIENSKENSEKKKKSKTPKNRINILNENSYLKVPNADIKPEFDPISGNQVVNGIC